MVDVYVFDDVCRSNIGSNLLNRKESYDWFRNNRILHSRMFNSDSSSSSID